jgi:PAS domain S-box-containing protein/putative nucleotidyltransferase with HDIG domain
MISGDSDSKEKLEAESCPGGEPKSDSGNDEQYRLIFENVPDVVWSLDTELRILGVSPSVERSLGYKPEELIGTTLTKMNADFRILQKATMEEMVGRAAAAIRGKKQKPSRYDLTAKDGSSKAVEISAAPVLDGGKVVGIICIARDIADQAETELNAKTTLSKLRATLGGIIQAMAETVERRDPYTAGHQRRVSDLARAIGQQLNLDENVVDGIRVAGLIHDLGKMGVPASILSKPGRLTSAEFAIIQTHPQVGFDIVRKIDFPWPVADMLFQHHERQNGSGYPERISAADILIEARILAVADTVEAMASDRPYRIALGIPEALAEIRKNAGILYDEDVARSCLQLFDDKQYHLKQI